MKKYLIHHCPVINFFHAEGLTGTSELHRDVALIQTNIHNYVGHNKIQQTDRHSSISTSLPLLLDGQDSYVQIKISRSADRCLPFKINTSTRNSHILMRFYGVSAEMNVSI